MFCVHGVHLVLSVPARGRGHGLDVGGDLADQGFADPEDSGDLAVGFPLIEQLFDVLLLGAGLPFVAVAEVVVLGGELAEGEVDETSGLLDLVDHDVVGVVAELPCPDFELFDVAEPGVFGGLADGEDGVEEVVELLGSGQVVLGDGAGEAALGRVGDDQERPAIAFLEVHQLHHEEAGVDTFVGAVAEVAQVVDDRDFALELNHRVLDVGEDLLFVVFDVEGQRVDRGTEQASWEGMEGVRVGIGVAHLELFVGEFAVHEEDVLGEGDLFGHLDGVDGFAQVGVGEEAADFSFIPEFVEQGVGVGPLACVCEGAVGGLDGEHADVVGRRGAFYFGGDGLDGVVVHGRVLLVLVAVDLAGLDGFVEFVGVDEGLALDLEDVDFPFFREPVECGGPDLQVFARFFARVVAFFFFLFAVEADLGKGFGEGGFQDILHETRKGNCVQHNFVGFIKSYCMGTRENASEMVAP